MDVVAVMISRRRPGTELSDKPSACHNLQALPQHGNVLRRARRVLHDSIPWLPGESGLHLSRNVPVLCGIPPLGGVLGVGIGA